jgi:hypothetical protein
MMWKDIDDEGNGMEMEIKSKGNVRRQWSVVEGMISRNIEHDNAGDLS